MLWKRGRNGGSAGSGLGGGEYGQQSRSCPRAVWGDGGGGDDDGGDWGCGG